MDIFYDSPIGHIDSGNRIGDTIADYVTGSSRYRD